MSARDLLDDSAVLGSDEDDESFDEGKAKEKPNGVPRFEDSSDEDDDDDEEEAAKIAEGFIVDESEEDDEARAERRKERKKRKREQRENEDEVLDDEDLDLIGFGRPSEGSPDSKFKRLKRGPRDGRDRHDPQDVRQIFGESDEEDAAPDYRRSNQRGLQDELEDFIEEDIFSDEEQERMQEDRDVAGPTRGQIDFGNLGQIGLTEAALEDMHLAFGDGTDYDFALDAEREEEDATALRDKQLDLGDVFEPSQLAERMLTDEDAVIRNTDEPERFQIARKPYRHVVLTDEQFREEAGWIADLLLPKRMMIMPRRELHEPFRQSIGKVLEFMVSEDYEVPFIFHNRKDYLIHAARSYGPDRHGDMQQEIEAVKLLYQTDLWEIFDLDLKFRGLIDKRNTLKSTYDRLLSNNLTPDETVEEMLPQAKAIEELQDIQDYLHFQYTSQLKDIAATTEGVMGIPRKPTTSNAMFERIRNGTLYPLVRAFGITADAFAQNASNQGVRKFIEDPSDLPDDFADKVLNTDFPTGTQALKAARAMFVEELYTSPRLRRIMRHKFYTVGVIDCIRTEAGLKKIDEAHPYYAFKYLRNQDMRSIARSPGLYLKMLKAEDEGLVEVKVRLQGTKAIKDQLGSHLQSDNVSDIADAWNGQRKEVLDVALERIMVLMSRLVKENLKNECEDYVANECRNSFTKKVDQAPYTPRGEKKGEIARILTVSNGHGALGRDPCSWIFMNEDGRVVDKGRWNDLAPGDPDREIADGTSVARFEAMVKKRQPDVIGVSGFTPETRKLQRYLETIIRDRDLRGASYIDEDERERSELLEVLTVNDEVARLYQNSTRAAADHPAFDELDRYCVALARYIQDPLLEYAALGKDLISIQFSPHQYLLPQDRALRQLETVLVDMTNLVGVEVNTAVRSSALANLLPFVAGMGPRKASHMLKIINDIGGRIASRTELLGSSKDRPAIGPKCWNNAVSALYVTYEKDEDDMEYLDNTRIHPEDYDIARKMAADALEMDEEDIQAEIKSKGSAAIVRQLVSDEAQDKVNDLVLEEYAVQLEKGLRSRKRATLENIRSELIDPFEELRNSFMSHLATDDVFTMFTGETPESLDEGMTVPMVIKRLADDRIDGKLDCGMDAFVPEGEMTDKYDVSIKSLYSVHQTVPGKIKAIDKKNLTVEMSLKEDEVKRPYRRYNDRHYDEWDSRQETADQKLLEEKTNVGGRATRVIKHPKFQVFNSRQAEEYLGSRSAGDLVIRPSSKGIEHLAVTWKVADGIFQHIDVLEMDKENEFTLGRTLKVGSHTYSDLDELIDQHVLAMNKKVVEMMLHEKFQKGTKADTDRWLTTYTEANPKRSVYVFCLNPKFPGYFNLCFKAGQHGRLVDWPVKVIPNGYELRKTPYPSMTDLCNGFKINYHSLMTGRA